METTQILSELPGDSTISLLVLHSKNMKLNFKERDAYITYLQHQYSQGIKYGNSLRV